MARWGETRRDPTRDARKSLINDPRAPTKVKIKVNGKTLTIKQKQKWDKGRDDTEMREGFLSLIREGFTNKDAAAACGCNSSYFRRRRKEDPDFEEAYQQAREDGNDVIRGEIKRRAVDGIMEPVYQQGRKVGEKQVYSDSLLIHLSKARMPEEFGDKQTVNHNHKLDGASEALLQKIGSILKVPVPELPPSNPDVIDITPKDVTDESE